MRRLPAAAAVIAAGAVLGLGGCVSSGGPSGGSKSSPRMAARYNTELAIDYMKEGRMDLAQRKLAEARRQAPHLPEVHNALALYYERIGENKQADHQYRVALHDKPGDPSTLNNYGAFLCRNGHPRKSLKYFTRAAENLDYDTPDAALANAGVCALKIPDKKLARQYFKRALAINANMGQALWHLGLADFEAGHYSQANQYLSRLVSSKSKPSARVLWVAIEAAWAVGDRDSAQGYGRELLKLYPHSDEAKKFIHLIGSGS